MTTPPIPQPTGHAAVQRATDYLQGIPLEERVPGYGGSLSDWDKEQILALLEDDAPARRPIPCPNCSATLYTHHHTECPRYGTEPPWEPISSDWQFGRDDSVTLAQNRSER
jgi:hypothetical protein